jgi:outer membrane protein assembly factor BamB
LYSLDENGQLRWSHSEGNTWMGDPALVKGVLYCASRNGFAFALRADTGEEIWRQRVTEDGGIPTDGFSILAVNGTMIIPADSGKAFLSNDRVLALNMADGKVKWVYNMPQRGFNLMPAAIDGDLIVFDTMGGMQRLALDDGSRRWYSPGAGTTGTTGGGCLGPNGLAYVVYNKQAAARGSFLASKAPADQACVRAASADSGVQVWEVCVEGTASAAPSVGQLTESVPLAVAFGYAKCSEGTLVDECHSHVAALDAASGGRVWSFSAPQGYVAMNFGGPSDTDPTLECIPDHFTNSAIDKDGRLYINVWNQTMMLKDGNEDGVIDTRDAAEYSVFTSASAIQGGPAISDRGLVVASCWTLEFFKA